MYNLDNFELELNNHLEASDFNSSLNSIVNFVESIIEDNRATVKVYGSATLDKLCQKIGAETLKIHYKNSVIINESLALSIYIATKLYNTGGHTAVIEDFIKAAPNKKHLILITDITNTAQRDVIENRFASLAVTIKWAPTSSLLDKLIWLQSELIEQQGQVFLFNHWQDAVAIAAVQPSITPELFFYHHCDHQLCLGLYLSHAQHIDLHSFGFYNCRNNLGVANNLYIPLAVHDLGTRPTELSFFAEGKLRTCSSGNHKKFENPYLYSYFEEIPKIISSTQGVHVHIGSLTDSILNRIYDSLKKQGIGQDSFVYIPWVKSLWKAMHEQRIDVYISSFPIFGARASVEVMGSGTPMIGHNNYHSRLLAGIDIIYPEAYFWQKPHELYNYLQTLTPEILREQSSYARSHYERFHTMSVLESSLEKLNLHSPGLTPEALRPHSYDQLQAFLDEITLDSSKQFIDIIDAIYPVLDKNQLKLDKNKASNFLYWLTTSYRKLEAYELALLDIEKEQAIWQTQLQNTQTELTALRSQLYETQEELRQIQTSKFWQLRTMWLKFKKHFGL